MHSEELLPDHNHSFFAPPGRRPPRHTLLLVLKKHHSIGAPERKKPFCLSRY